MMGWDPERTELILRASMAFGTAALSVLIAGPPVIRWLSSRVGERIASDSARLNELHAAKRNTPTMGGILIVLATLLGLVCASTGNSPLPWISGVTLFVFAVIGSFDDWVKLRTSRKGLSARGKLAAQTVSALAVAAAMKSQLPVAGAQMPNSLTGALDSTWSFVLWTAFVLVAASNAVNLSDGLDGLAAGCTVLASLALGAVVLLQVQLLHSTVSQDAMIGFAAIAGSTAGFLWFNRHPARVFMGDTGSLSVGAFLGINAIASGHELLLAVAGGVFVVETVSVMLQVWWYRRTRRRILLCSPLHNHFVFQGVPETRIVRGFWLAGVLFGILSLTLFALTRG